MNKEFWDARYAESDYAYGKEPNAFFKAQIAHINTGKMLLPAEGEGRNAVYAAASGWEVDAMDMSVEGRNKALALANEMGTSIHYDVVGIDAYTVKAENYDLVAMIYSHVPAELKSVLLSKMSDALKPGGRLIAEVFSKEHPEYQKIHPRVGGPSHPDVLYSIEEFKEALPNFEFKVAEVTEVQLEEGLYHLGTGSAVRIVAIKK